MKRKIILTFIIILLIKIISSLIIGYVEIPPDSGIFIQISEGFLNFNVLEIYTKLEVNSFPLYPLILSPIFMLPKSLWFLGAIILNSIIYSSVAFPIYFILKELKVKKLFEITVITALLPAIFFYPNFIMAENLLIPLFLTSFYFLIKADQKPTLKNIGIFLIFAFLTYLTKIMGGVLFIGLIYLILNKKSIKNLDKKTIILFFLLVVFLILILQISLPTAFTNSLERLINLLQGLIFFKNILIILFLSLIYILFSTFGVIGFINKNKISKYGLLICITYILIFILSQIHALESVKLSSIHLRYIDPIIPLLFILGISNIENFKKIEKNKLIVLILVFIVISSLFLILGTPIENKDIVWPATGIPMLIFLFRPILFLFALILCLLWIRYYITTKYINFLYLIILIILLLNGIIFYFISNS